MGQVNFLAVKIHHTCTLTSYNSTMWIYIRFFFRLVLVILNSASNGNDYQEYLLGVKAACV